MWTFEDLLEASPPTFNQLLAMHTAADPNEGSVVAGLCCGWGRQQQRLVVDERLESDW